MQRMIRPLAIRLGVKSRAKQSRFMEQFYTALYFGIYGPFGLYVMSRTPVWYFNTTAMFENFPHKTHEGLFKTYYLLQASYWAQQGLVLLLMLEKPRKDFKELVLHHIITLALIWLSYRFHFTYMGIAVYITMDISDFFLAVSPIFLELLPKLLSPLILTCHSRPPKSSTISTRPSQPPTLSLLSAFGSISVITSMCASSGPFSPSSAQLVPLNSIGTRNNTNAGSRRPSLSACYPVYRLSTSSGLS